MNRDGIQGVTVQLTNQTIATHWCYKYDSIYAIFILEPDLV